MVFEVAGGEFTAAAGRLNKESHRRRWLELIEEALAERQPFETAGGQPP
jgi:hypothetical protein